ncbi:hypothetical protein BD779DRAFT_1465068 [Infundibulicybe gibba]|nr:hypothetical protein BD779DRAFT_1465068 [Infundibulicybe gibba]
MQRLGYQSRCWTHPRLWNIRHNSSVQTVADGEKHVERPHVASSWAGIAIPSREEILRKPDAEQTVPTVNPTKQFRADLSYLNKRGSGLAGRLARKLDSSQLQEQAVAPVLSIPTAPKQEVRHDPTIAQRRKERWSAKHVGRRRGGPIPSRRFSHPLLLTSRSVIHPE